MSMNRIDHADALRQGALSRFRQTGQAERAREAEKASVPAAGQEQATDRVEISAAARRLMEIQDALAVGRDAVQQLDEVRDERVDEVRRRLDAGYYNAVEVQSKVAEGVSHAIDGLEAL